MTNDELCLKILETLGNKYKIGLHNSTRDTYIYKSKFDCVKFNIDESIVTEDKIMDSILKKGLFVPYRSFGPLSTVTFLSNLIPSSFDYSYYKTDSDKRYVVVVAIPKYIHLKGERYFIGDMFENSSIIAYDLFSEIIPKEFIYGYYVKQVIDKDEEYYDEEFLFQINDKFYGFMSFLEQENFWIKFFQENGIEKFILHSNMGIVEKFIEKLNEIKNRNTKKKILRRLRKK